MIDTAVIMAAGKRTRFGTRTADMPKGFIEFKGRSMIERSIANLLSVGIKRIIIGTGYHREWYEKLCSKYPQIITVFSPEYAETNSMETLYRCCHAIADSDFLLLESDIVYEDRALGLLLEDGHPNVMLASDITKFQDQYYLAVDSHKHLIGCSTNKEALVKKYGNEPYGELVGIHRISDGFYKRMCDDYCRGREVYLRRGYEFMIEDTAMSSSTSTIDKTLDSSAKSGQECKSVYVLKPKHLEWYEIDDENDLQYAQENINII